MSHVYSRSSFFILNELISCLTHCLWNKRREDGQPTNRHIAGEEDEANILGHCPREGQADKGLKRILNMKIKTLNDKTSSHHEGHGTPGKITPDKAII